MPNHNPVVLSRAYYNPCVTLSRRGLLTAAALPLLGQEAARKLRIVITGGHPGDPECGCGGTVAKYVAAGHEAVLLYLNRGEGYCGSAALDQCGAIRTAEAKAACRVLNARAVFADQTDGQAVVDDSHYKTFARTLMDEKPDAVFTHWPIDRHRDHRAISDMVLDAWLKSGRQFALYYYEVAEDTMMFQPSEYVDISGVEAPRHQACYAHVSQQPDKWYPKQVAITRFRGTESGFGQTEAFARHPESRRILLP